MEKQLTEKQLSARENVHRIITEWKKRRAQDENEAADRLNSPQYREAIEKLKKKNEERGIIIPGL